MFFSTNVKLKVVFLSGSESHCFKFVGFSLGIGKGFTVNVISFEILGQAFPILFKITLNLWLLKVNEGFLICKEFVELPS